MFFMLTTLVTPYYDACIDFMDSHIFKHIHKWTAKPFQESKYCNFV